MSKTDSKRLETDTYQKDNIRPAISVKEARKILGKKVSDQLSDEEIGRLIGSMTFIANRLLEEKVGSTKINNFGTIVA